MEAIMSDWRIIEGDCLEVMKDLEPGSVDAIITDLPYGTTACKWDTVIPFAPMWEQVKRILKPRGAFVTTASQPFTSALVMSNLEWFKYCLVYVKSKKTGFQHAKNAPLKRHEDIAIFSPGVVNHDGMTDNRMNYFPQFAPGKPYKKFHKTPNVGAGSLHRATGANLRFVGTTLVNHGFRYPDSVLEFDYGNHGIDHPTQKPVALYEYLVLTYSNPGDTILDIAMGSGTTGVACLKTGRRFIGIELDPTYCEIARKRLTEAEAQPLLFAA